MQKVAALFIYVALATLSLGADDAYWRWTVAKFGQAIASDPIKQSTVWGENADPDGDGIRNLLEYAANTDPNTRTQLSDVSSYSTSAGTSPGSHPQMIAWQRTDDPDLRVLPQVSTDCQTWFPAPPPNLSQPLPFNFFVTSSETASNAPGLRQMRHQDNLTLAGRPAAFMRLLVIRGNALAAGPSIEPFAFTSQPAVPVNLAAAPSVARSSTVTLAGFTGTLTVNIPAGTTLFVNGVAQTGSVAVVKAGDSVWMQATAPTTVSTTRNYTLTIGGVSSTWSFTTAALTAVPDHPGVESGYTPVETGVSETGAAQISIPIVVSPGTAGMQPKLSINYSSQGGNGPLGRGFSLSGLSSISRTGATVAQDGFKAGVAFNANDRYALDGQRLIAINGTDGDHNTEYRLEFDPTSRIRSIGLEESSVQSWVVETKAGLTMRYGGPLNDGVNARIRPENCVYTLSWPIREIEDSAGNKMQFFYALPYSDRGELILTRVAYTSNPSLGLSAQQEVVFEYEDRPDARTGFVAGFAMKTQKRLTAMESRATEGGIMKRVRRYEMTYQLGEISGPSQLKQVREITADGTQLPPTVFAWDTNGDPNMTTTTAAQTPGLSSIGFTASPPGMMVQGDFDGDGRMDVMHLDDGGSFMLACGQSDGSFQVTQPVADFTIAEAVSQSSGNLRTGDFNADGKSDLLYLSQTPAKNWLALSRGDKTFEIRKGAQLGVFQNVGISVGFTQVLALDVNGDGRTDVVVIEPSDSANRPNRVYLASTAASFNEVDPGAAFKFLRVSDNRSTYSWVIPGDYNGDGQPDILHLYWNGQGHWLALSNGDGTFSVRTSNQLGGLTNQSFHRSWSYWVSGDYNGDGLTDVANFNNQGVGMVFYCKGDGTFTPVSLPASLQGRSVSDPQYAHFYGGDVNGDGVSDIFHAFFSHNADLSFLAYAVGDGTFSTFVGAAMGALSQQRYYDPEHVPESRVFVGDFDGDGTDDFLGINHSIENYLTRSNGFDPYRIDRVTNGHGGYTKFAYRPLTTPGLHTKGSGMAYPFVDIQMPMSVVAWVTSRNAIDGDPFTGAGAGTLGENTVNYHYEGAWSDLGGRGFQGFKKVTTTDQTSGIVSHSVYHSGNPLLSGRPILSESWTPGGALIKRTVTNWLEVPTTHPTGFKTHFIYPSASWDYSFETNNQPQVATPITTTTTFGLTHDAYGNVTHMIVDHGGGFQEDVTNNYTNTVDATRWHLGRLSSATVVKFSPKSGGGYDSLTRSSSFAYHSTTGLLTQEVIEPGGGALRQEKNYTHDGFGNILTSTVSCSGETSRTTTTTYTADGRFVATTSNAKGHTESKTYDPLLGNVLTQTGPNGLTTSWQYDALGRPIREARPDGTESRSFYRKAAGVAGAPPRAVHYVRVQSSGGAPKTVWYDVLDREIRADSVSFDGRTVSAHKVFNDRGEVKYASQPYFAGDVPLYSEMFYDAVGRETQQIDPGNRITTTAYNGLTTSVTNPKTQTVSSTANVMGWTVQSTDAAGKSINRSYDPYGNLRFVTDPAGNSTELRYDVRGNKIWMSEPNSGVSTFAYNGFGELISQTNAAGQTVNLIYDTLGRVITRLEPEGVTFFQFDTAEKGIGQLARESAPGFTRSFFYDGLSRPAATVESHGYQSFAVSRGYDQYGRPAALTFPTGFAVRQNYTANGHLASVQNAANSAQSFWTAGVVNARGQVTQETLGNGIATTRGFEAETGLIQSIVSSNGVQNADFQFDSIGNLTRRRDLRFSANFIETFGYDSLNRLTGVTTTGAAGVSVGYNDLGNITSRSDVGTFAYGGNGSGPHALTGVTGGAFDKACAYNAKGERITDGATSLDYSSFGKPVRIRKGGENLRFDYGSDRSLYRQTLFRTDANGLETQTVRDYIGGLYERETTSEGLVRHIHYIAGGSGVVAIFTDERSATNPPDRLRYIHKDHLGSVDVITNEIGSVVERQSFDAWGRRRTLTHDAGNWLVTYPGAPAPGATSSSGETHRGFTGHEMLDAVGLVHMGGRVYDPLTARFLSPDPFVQSPDNLQNLNRYSYVLNNPLSFTDPSGFFFKAISKFLKKTTPLGWVTNDKQWNQVFSMAIGIGLTVVTGGWGAPAFLSGAIGGFGSAFSGTLLAGGSVGDALRAGLQSGAISGLSAGLTKGISSELGLHDLKPGTSGFRELLIKKAIVHGTIQGGISELQGGKFVHGFASGATSALASPYIQHSVPEGFQTVAAAVSGGTASVLGGGKFENGAVSGAFVYLFNQIGAKEEVGGAGDKFPTADDAAKRVLTLIHETSINGKLEYAGRIYMNSDGTYSYTLPAEGEADRSWPHLSPVPPGGQNAGAYHTHGRVGYGRNSFSDQDVYFADSQRQPIYLGAPNGEMLKYTPGRTPRFGNREFIGHAR